MKAILDIIFIAIILACAWTGYKKRLIMGIGGILAIIISIYGANLLSNTFSAEIVPAMRPFVSGYMDTKFTESIYDTLGYEPDENGEYDVEYSIPDLLDKNPGIVRIACINSFKAMGVAYSSAEIMADEAIAYTSGHTEYLKDSVSETFCSRFSYIAGFLLAFALIIIVLTVVGNLPNLSFAIPYIGIADNIAGAVIGLVRGIALCLVLGYALKFTGLILPQDTIADTWLACKFVNSGLITNYLGL